MQDVHVTIGLLMAVYNAEFLLRELLPYHAPHFDEVIVVHDGPVVDDTLDVAHSIPNCRAIATRYRQGYCEPVRQIALGMATTDWCLALDDDEQLTGPFLQIMRAKVAWAENNGVDGFTLGRLETNHEVTFHPRLFKRGRAYFSDVIHTNVFGLQNTRLVGRGEPLERKGDYQIIHHPTAIIGAQRGRGRADNDDPVILQEKKRRYAHVQQFLRLKYGEYHPELLQPGRALGIDYS